MCCVHPVCVLCTPCRPCRDGSSASGRGVLSMQGLSHVCHVHPVCVLCTPCMSVWCCVHPVCVLCTPCRPCRDGSSASGRGVLSMQGLSHGVVRVNSGSNLTSLTLQDCGQVLPGGKCRVMSMLIYNGLKNCNCSM